jgi:hypothetical protein
MQPVILAFLLLILLLLVTQVVNINDSGPECAVNLRQCVADISSQFAVFLILQLLQVLNDVPKLLCVFLLILELEVISP